MREMQNPAARKIIDFLRRRVLHFLLISKSFAV
jgi:hypothetical protein